MAISLDNTTTSMGTSTTSPYTFSHTVSGSNRILYVQVFAGFNGDIVTGITYNGTTMSFVGKIAANGFGSSFIYLYQLIAPATGSNTVSINLGGSSGADIRTTAISYAGALQTGQPDAHTTNSSTGTTYATSVTTVSDNCWVLESYSSTGGLVNAGSSTTLRSNMSGQGVADSNGPKTPAGSFTLNLADGTPASRSWSSVIASFSPAPVSANGSFLINFL